MGSIGALPARGSGVSARHFGRDLAFIQEHQAFHGKRAHLLAVTLAVAGNLGPILFGPQKVFLERSLRRLSASQITARHPHARSLGVRSEEVVHPV
jgi:hypothetical protein